MCETNMENDKLIAVLRGVSIEPGSLVCLGCGHEHSCGIHGCAILRAAADCMERLSAQLAERDEQLAAAVNDIKHPSVCECCCGGCQGDAVCIDNGYMNFDWRGVQKGADHG